jgi:hypothetical protein
MVKAGKVGVAVLALEFGVWKTLPLLLLPLLPLYELDAGACDEQATTATLMRRPAAQSSPRRWAFNLMLLPYLQRCLSSSPIWSISIPQVGAYPSCHYAAA